jgi:hypothetical protein
VLLRRVINVNEMKAVMGKHGKKPEVKARLTKLCQVAGLDIQWALVQGGLFKTLDLDGDGNLLVKELMFAIDEKVGLFSIFNEIDADGSGYIEKKELPVLEKRKNFMDKIKLLHPTAQGNLASVLDADGDGLITFAEFSTKLKGFGTAGAK